MEDGYIHVLCSPQYSMDSAKLLILLIYLFIPHLLSGTSVPGTLLGTRNINLSYNSHNLQGN